MANTKKWCRINSRMMNNAGFVIFWDVTLCSVVAGYQRFRRSCCLLEDEVAGLKGPENHFYIHRRENLEFRE